jgi:hypothetical protein
MSLEEKVKYNIDSSKKFGWSPSWLGCSDFNEDLINRIIEFQKSLGISADGLVGPITYRRLLTAREFEAKKTIICGGKEVEIDWPKVINMNQPGALKVAAKTFRKTPGRKPSLFVVHWDACLSSASCASVLSQRGLSVHFCIDNDGTIYQLVDAENVAYHASNANGISVGVEVSNAFYAKYQPWYEKNGFGKRPVLTDSKINGIKIEDHLGFYQIQEQALKVLIATICNHYGIPMVVPKDSGGKLIEGEVDSVKNNKFSGVVCHYHITKDKIDCAGLNLQEMVENK